MARGGNNKKAITQSGDIVPFPIARRTGIVRQCAAELETKHGAEAVAYWRSKCRVLADELLSQGCSEQEASRQVMIFQDQVQAEMMYRSQGHETLESASV